MTPGEFCRAVLIEFVRVGVLLVACVSVTVILADSFDISFVTEDVSSLSTMKVNTACGLLAAAMALWILHTGGTGALWIRAARVLATLALAVGALTLAEYLFGIDLRIDRLLLRGSAHAQHVLQPARMSPAAAISLAFFGLALLALKARQPKLAACAHWLIVPPLLLAALAAIGYAYGVSTLYRVDPYPAMAAHTAVAILVFALSTLAADSAYGFASIASSDTAGALVSRRLLPTLPAILFVLGWLCLQGQSRGLYDIRVALALLVLATIAVCVVAIVWTANTLHAVDLTRKRAEAEILSLNAGLEMRVRERTHELSQVSAQLSLVNSSLEQLSRHDSLTGLANRRFFDSYLADQIAIARRHKRSLALVLCDVDSFKAYNDHYGHQAGDECLKQVAAALKSCCRRSADMAARYGGEEFAMILPDTEHGAALQIAEAAREAVATLKIAHATSLTASHISISGGLAVQRRRQDMNAEQLIMDADRNLFAAKHLGRNRMVAAATEAA